MPTLTTKVDDRPEALQARVRTFEQRAQQAAEQGDVTEAARCILAALDAERRMAARGPQVLQVIKPRG